MKTTTTCTCGCTEVHEVARRLTANGIRVVGYSDGTLTMGLYLYSRPGYPMAAFWLVMGEVELYTSDEFAKLVQTARKAVGQKRQTPLAYLRDRLPALLGDPRPRMTAAQVERAEQAAHTFAARRTEQMRLAVEKNTAWNTLANVPW